MFVVGLVGGVASGKSLVTERLESLGAVVLNADRIGHEVLLCESVKSSIRERWGEVVFTDAGEVNRRQLAAIVFDPDNSDELARLEQITHPLIEERLRNELKRIRAAGQAPAVVLDAAIMVKTGWYQLCDEILFIDSQAKLRKQRAAARGWTAEMLARREAMQAPLDEKRRISTYQIENNRSKQELYQKVDEFWHRLVSG